jgi:hypothetical protein
LKTRLKDGLRLQMWLSRYCSSRDFADVKRESKVSLYLTNRDFGAVYTKNNKI